jgi:hypothetical protein
MVLDVRLGHPGENSRQSAAIPVCRIVSFGTRGPAVLFCSPCLVADLLQQPGHVLVGLAFCDGGDFAIRSFDLGQGTFSRPAESKNTVFLLQETQAIPFLKTRLLKYAPQEDVCAVFCLPFHFPF